MSTALGCIAGRFQPVHNQHLELFDIALGFCEHLLIAVTNPDPGARRREPSSSHRHTSAANPFTYFERATLLRTALIERGIDKRTTIVPFDLTRRDYWSEYVPLNAHHLVRTYSDWERHKADLLRDAGYLVTTIEGDPTIKLNASDIRRLLAENNGSWKELVPKAVIPVLQSFVTYKPLERRS